MTTRIAAAVLFAAFAALGTVRPASAQDLSKLGPLGKEAQAVADGAQLAAALRPAQPRDEGPLRPNRARTRGPAFAVYPDVAPATVVVRTANGHGTGFVVDPEGWIVTNHHVIADAGLDVKTGALKATVHFGRIEDDVMELIEEGVPAVVYKATEEKDLALLKLEAKPKSPAKLPALKLAAEAPRPGTDCVAIGHPAAGMLWTVRSGEISGVGRWPGQMIDVVMHRLTTSGAARDELAEALQKAPQRKVVVSSCGLNPGDSGGALVNDKGEVVGVSFAIPRSRESGVNLDKFSYHLHLDELKAFLADRPKTPAMAVPDPWPPALCARPADFDKDGKLDLLLFAEDPVSPVIGLLVDLDGDGKLPKKRPPLDALRERFDFEFALQRVPTPRAFYDTTNSGKPDLVLIDTNRDARADLEFRRTGATWEVRPGAGHLFDPERFRDAKLKARFLAFAKFFNAAAEDPDGLFGSEQ